MELKVIRNKFTNESTEGELWMNGERVCYTLEDADRGLVSTMPLSIIKDQKIFGKTAIPYGRYEIITSFSNHFKKALPLLLNVPGFDGVRIHAGNKPEDTEGCLLLGTVEGVNFIYHSVDAFNLFMRKLHEAGQNEKNYIEYLKYHL